jgi:hypothetical protein
MHVQPVNIVERFFTVICVVCGLVGFSYIVGSITGSLGELRALQEKTSKQFLCVRRFLRQNRVNRRLQMEINMYLMHAWGKYKSHIPFTSIKLFELLSVQLQDELHLHLVQDKIQLHPLLIAGS